MHITNLYRYKNENGATVISAQLPEGIEPELVMPILEADEGMILRNKETQEEIPNIWLKDGINKDDYEETEMEVEDGGTTDVA